MNPTDLTYRPVAEAEREEYDRLLAYTFDPTGGAQRAARSDGSLTCAGDRERERLAALFPEREPFLREGF
jgi:hypothetical protein